LEVVTIMPTVIALKNIVCFLTHTLWNSVSGVFRRVVFIGMQPAQWQAFWDGECGF
jgi:hypothetical protein